MLDVPREHVQPGAVDKGYACGGCGGEPEAAVMRVRCVSRFVSEVVNWHTMKRVAQVFHGFPDAERADEEYYALLSPRERVDILLELIERYRSSLGQAAERFERVHRFTQLNES